MRDVLLFNATNSPQYAALADWRERCPDLQDFWPDYHRLQLEYWIWSKRDQLTGSILDVGVDNPRRWIGNGYQTFGLAETHDLRGNLLDLTRHVAPRSVNAVILTEVLEHCLDPRAALREVKSALKPGGLLLVTSPFLWPWHGTDDYADYWRFTRQGWEVLLQPFDRVTITPTDWTPEAMATLDLTRRFEGWGFASLIDLATGYLCEAYRPED